ncbi:hypothetical protein B0H15DRAFT_951056 [Mycena belliarum]|uniref:Uncharacterized protein n=1 Tax=Mycena belliarum TaxID=1033014 RepID=A0AAD6U0F6_9AGAR|nr:hypothetical protein B0H15DRAFT_951056 [Mycena belliae]
MAFPECLALRGGSLQLLQAATAASGRHPVCRSLVPVAALRPPALQRSSFGRELAEARRQRGRHETAKKDLRGEPRERCVPLSEMPTFLRPPTLPRDPALVARDSGGEPAPSRRALYDTGLPAILVETLPSTLLLITACPPRRVRHLRPPVLPVIPPPRQHVSLPTDEDADTEEDKASHGRVGSVEALRFILGLPPLALTRRICLSTSPSRPPPRPDAFRDLFSRLLATDRVWMRTRCRWMAWGTGCRSAPRLANPHLRCGLCPSACASGRSGPPAPVMVVFLAKQRSRLSSRNLPRGVDRQRAAYGGHPARASSPVVPGIDTHQATFRSLLR